MTAAENPPSLYTVGHSNHTYEGFLALLRGIRAELVVDVRSAPVSRWVPHFDKSALERRLPADGIGYRYLGRGLGARPRDPGCYVDGRISYAAIARTAAFREGLEELRRLRARSRVVLMCAERDPLDCHRLLLVARALKDGTRIRHLLPDGRVEENTETEARLLAGLPGTHDLFEDPGLEPVDAAYEARVAKMSQARSTAWRRVRRRSTS